MTMLNFDKLFDQQDQPPPSSQQLKQTGQALLESLQYPETDFTLTALSGGYRNFNYLLKTGNQSGVMRLASDPSSLARELALLSFLAHAHPVPAVLASLPGAALLEYCPGVLPSQLNLSQDFTCEADIQQLGSAIGQTLARLHAIQFSGSGFLNTSLEIADPLEPFAMAWLSYTSHTLKTPSVRQRAGSELCDAILTLLQRQGPLLEQLPEVNRLVHSDFNLKNILVKKQAGVWLVSAVLDWEFAHAGSPLSDLGNFLRFADSLPQALIQGFLAGYQVEYGPLPANWYEMSLLLDLAALGGFLESHHASPLSWATAIRCLKKTLRHF